MIGEQFVCRPWHHLPFADVGSRSKHLQKTKPVEQSFVAIVWQ
jgi:hypothetical protein